MSSLSKSFAFTVATFIFLTVIIVGHLSGVDPEGFALIGIFLSIASCYYLYKAKKLVAKIGAVCLESTKGNFEVRIVAANETGDLQLLVDKINTIIDTADAYVRESKATLLAASEERYYRKIMPVGMSGTYLQAANIINEGMDAIRKNLINSMKKAAKKLEESVKKTAEDLLGSTEEIQATSTDLSSVAEQVKSQAGQLSVSSEETARNVNTVAAAAEELFASISEITRQTAQSNMIASDAVHKAKSAETVLDSLVKGAEAIGEISSLINDVADKINLLALNASIEAARAGEHGKGFAVVANEVKSLAVQTGNATSEIAKQISSTQDDIRKTSTVVHDIGTTINTINEISSSIASAIEEQGAATKEISSSIQSVAESSSKVSSAVQDVFAASERTGQAAVNMKGSSVALSKQSAELNKEIDKFITEIENQ